ncbi:MAG TPA: TraB/GumN family protein [Kofleriaceae bacterium]|jgi:uncharacterized protein YbaP (TraB family)
MRSALALIVLATLGACASAPTCKLPTIPQPVHPWLWTVRGPHGAIVLFGTHHGAAEDDLPAAAKGLLASSKVLVVEAEEGGKYDTYDQNPDARYYLRRPEVIPSLMKTLSNDEFAELKGRLHVSSQQLAKMRPWVAQSLLMRTVVVFPSPNMATAISDLAEDHHIRVDALDSWQMQTVFLDMVSDAHALQQALYVKDLACAFDADVNRYRSGLEEAYAASETSSPNPNRLPAIEERQRVWTDKLAAYLESGEKAFVAVGVQNIVGDQGVLAALAARGYAVERIDPH